MKRWIPFISVCLVVIFIGGLLIGSVTEAGQQAVIWNARQTTQTTIAVVNADTGVMIDGERQNYSAAIIEALEEEFVQASPALASAGFLDGNFGAIITFPADVSERILTFNDRDPQRVQLEFQLNPNLSEEDYIKTYIRILNLQMAMNTALAQTYVSSIFNQFHAGQNQVDNVFANNQAKVDAMEVVKLEDFTGSLNLEYIPTIPFEPTPFDGSNHFVSMEGFAAQVASLYLDSYRAASASYLSMRDGFFTMTDNIPALANDWLDRLDAWARSWEDYGAAQRYYESLLQIFQEELEEYLELFNASHEEYEQQIEEIQNFFTALNSWLGHLEDNEAQLRTYQDGLMANYIAAHVAFNEQVSTAHSHFEDLEEWMGELNEYRNALSTYRTEVEGLRDAILAWNDITTWHTNFSTSRNTLYSHLASIPPMPNSSAFDLTDPEGEAAFNAAFASWQDQMYGIAESVSAVVSNLQAIQGGIDLPDIINNYQNIASVTEPPPSLPEEALANRPDNINPMPYNVEMNITWNASPDAPDMTLDYLEFDPPESPEVFTTNQPAQNSPASAEGFLEPLNQMRGQLETFDVDAFLSDSIMQQVEATLVGYSSYLDFIRSGLSLHADGNNMLLSNIYFEYTNYLMELRRAALAAEAYEMIRLGETLTEFYDIHSDTSGDTYERLAAFAEMMPESRDELGRLNQALISYTVAPFEFIPPVLREIVVEETVERPTMEDTFRRYMSVGLPVLGVVLLLTILSYFIPRKKKEEG